MNTVSKGLRLITAVFLCEIVGVLAIPFTTAAIPTWYASLNKPIFSPPNWLFAPVWTVLYALMGISVFLVWEKGIKKQPVTNGVRLFSLQLGLNFLWSVIFFGLHSPLLALIDIILLLIAIGAIIVMFNRISKLASYFLIPYFFWVGFACYLNYSIWILNK